MVVEMTAGTVWDNANWQRQEFLHLVSQFVATVHTERVRDAVGPALLDQLLLQIQQIRSRLDTDFSLVVMGDFKRGKSTLVNALLEMPLVPTDVTPSTMTINEIQYGPEVTVTAHLHDGRQIRLDVTELAANRLVPLLTQDMNDDLPASVGSIDRSLLQNVLAQVFNMEELEQLCFELGLTLEDLHGDVRRTVARELILYMERHGRFRELVKTCYQRRQSVFIEAIQSRPPIHRQLPQLEKLRQEVSHLTVTAPVKFLQGMRLVDTPGVSDLLTLFDNQVQEYIAKADAVIYVLSVRYPLSQAEREFLRRALQPRDFAKLFFVVNRIDEESESKVGRFLDHVQGQIGQLFPDAPLFGLSALDEYCRLSGEDRPNPNRASTLAQAFAQFRGGLRQAVFLNRDMMQLERTIARMERVLIEFEASLRNVQQAIEADQQQLRQTIAQYEDVRSSANQQVNPYKQQLHLELAEVGNQASRWLATFLDRMERETIPSVARVKLVDIQRYFHFFLANALSAAMHQCLDAQRPFIINLVCQIRQSMHADIRASALELALPATSASTNTPESTAAEGEEAWLNIDVFDELAEQSTITISSFANELMATVSSFLNEKQEINESRLLAHYQDALRQALPRLRDAVKIEVQSLYNHLANLISTQLDSSYHKEVEEVLAIMHHAQTLRRSVHLSDAVDTSILQETLTVTTNTRQALSHFKENLWSSDTSNYVPT